MEDGLGRGRARRQEGGEQPVEQIEAVGPAGHGGEPVDKPLLPVLPEDVPQSHRGVGEFVQGEVQQGEGARGREAHADAELVPRELDIDGRVQHAADR